MSDRIPLSTYRVQLNHRFTLKQAIETLPYLAELGISALYVSPIMKAHPGSLHGYDVLDCCQLNPEIGTEEELYQLFQALHALKMGLLLDIVPNHMSIATPDNKWWQDVLENGKSSLFADYFNIIWEPPKAELKNKVLLPVLDQQYGKVIENQEIKLIYDAGAFFIAYKARSFPVDPRTWPNILKHVVELQLPKLGEDNVDLLELQSIITALEHLPDIEKTDPEKLKERNREKEIIKKRLTSLVENTPTIKETIENVLLSFNGQKGDPHSFDQLEELLKLQAYRLSFWRVTNDEINYRRFFDINDLITMHVEKQEVFDAMHELIFKYVKAKGVTGFRADHVDGLFDPYEYFIRLQIASAYALDKPPEPIRDFYVIVEKILMGDENLRSEWLVHGTTGYDFLNLVNGLFVASENRNKMKQIYHHFIDRYYDMLEVFYTCKKLILTFSMSSELHILARHLETVAEQHRWSIDYTLEALRSALREVIACFPVYRTYIRLKDTYVQKEDYQTIVKAIREAKRRNPASEHSIFDFIQSVLLLDDPPGLTEEQIQYRRQFVMCFQQITSPVTAKGVEDTAFYRYYPLSSINEVGMDPNSFGTSVVDFHKKNQARLQKWPHTLLTTSTHDTKRSEDVRSRINVLSEDPEKWNDVLYHWHTLNQNKKATLDGREVPDNNEEFLLYQTLIGCWPLYPMDASTRAQFVDRIVKYMIKALKEAKIHTSWINANEAYENGVQQFVQNILNLAPDNVFLEEFEKFIPQIQKAGMYNSLSQILLKMTVPGIPDIYQGNELWEFNLVDPDNRRPVDYSNRQQLLNGFKQRGEEDPSLLVTHLMESPEDGRIKLFVTMRILNLRQKYADLFQEGEYFPIEVTGESANHVVAFSREKNHNQVIIVAGRFYTKLTNLEMNKPIGKIWKKTDLILPTHMKGEFRDLFDGKTVLVNQEGKISLDQLFEKLPISALEKIT